MKSNLEVSYPMSLPSVANLREHWAARAKRTKHHRFVGKAAVSQRAVALTPPLRITLTRVAPRSLDSDNLASAFKGLRDGIAEGLGLDDGDSRLEWAYAQAKGAVEVRIAIVEVR